MKQLKEYFNDYLEFMKTNYESRAEWYNRCKTDTKFYYEEMEKYAISDAYIKAVRLHKRIEKAEDMPERTNKEIADKAKYLWSISCNYRKLLYKELIEDFLSDESIAFCVDTGLIKNIDEVEENVDTDNKLFFDINLYEKVFKY